MIYIYQADSDIVKQNSSLQLLLNNLPENMHTRALRYKFEQDAFNFITGRLLLRKALDQVGRAGQFDQISYRESGKPFLEDIFFSISHSVSKVVCALSLDGEIGIDVEKEKPVKMDDFKPWFTEVEWAEIKSASSPLQRFYWYWTRKESIIKALGVNLSYLHQIKIDATRDYFVENENKWYLENLDFGAGFTSALCSSQPIRGAKYFLNIDKLLGYQI